jgi:hypothetical protein
MNNAQSLQSNQVRGRLTNEIDRIRSQGGGIPLDSAFSNLRYIYTKENASRNTTPVVDALAHTWNRRNQIVFEKKSRRPSSAKGLRPTGHQLVHLIPQDGEPPPGIQRKYLAQPSAKKGGSATILCIDERLSLYF